MSYRIELPCYHRVLYKWWTTGRSVMLDICSVNQNAPYCESRQISVRVSVEKCQTNPCSFQIFTPGWSPRLLLSVAPSRPLLKHTNKTERSEPSWVSIREINRSMRLMPKVEPADFVKTHHTVILDHSLWLLSKFSSRFVSGEGPDNTFPRQFSLQYIEEGEKCMIFHRTGLKSSVLAWQDTIDSRRLKLSKLGVWHCQVPLPIAHYGQKEIDWEKRKLFKKKLRGRFKALTVA